MKNSTKNVASHLLLNRENVYTGVGFVFRKLSLDEIPQLVNILQGDMNFIGPRPALDSQYNLIKLRTNLEIHKIKPGVTGWAQVNGRDNLSSEEKVEKDFYYVSHRSFKLNLLILFYTVINVIGVKNIRK